MGTDERDGLQSVRAKNEKHLNTLDRELDEAIEYGETLDKNIRNLETNVSELSAAKKDVEDKQAVEKKKSRTKRISLFPNWKPNLPQKEPKMQNTKKPLQQPKPLSVVSQALLLLAKILLNLQCKSSFQINISIPTK